MKNRIVPLYALLLSTGAYSSLAQGSHSQIQVEFGPRVGANIATGSYKYDYSNYDLTTAAITRFEGGLSINISRNHWALQPSILYSQKGFVLNGQSTQASVLQSGITSSIQLTHAFNYLTVPLNVVYTPKNDGQGVQLFAGGYLSSLLGGKYNSYGIFQGRSFPGDPPTTTVSQAELPVRAGAEFLSDGYFYSKRFDAGLQAGIGYRLGSLLAQVSYSAGLTNLGLAIPRDPAPVPPRYYTRTFQASLSYLFNLNSHELKK